MSSNKNHILDEEVPEINVSVLAPAKNRIIISGKSYNIHPVYDLYAGSRDGDIINIVNKKKVGGHTLNTGYLSCMVRKHAQKRYKIYMGMF
jgi:hypothetical protein